MNSAMISNRKDRITYGAGGAAPPVLTLSPMSLRMRLPRSGKKSSLAKSSLLLGAAAAALSAVVATCRYRRCPCCWPLLPAQLLPAPPAGLLPLRLAGPAAADRPCRPLALPAGLRASPQPRRCSAPASPRLLLPAPHSPLQPTHGRARRPARPASTIEQ